MWEGVCVTLWEFVRRDTVELWFITQALNLRWENVMRCKFITAVNVIIPQWNKKKKSTLGRDTHLLYIHLNSGVVVLNVFWGISCLSVLVLLNFQQEKGLRPAGVIVERFVKQTDAFKFTFSHLTDAFIQIQGERRVSVRSPTGLYTIQLPKIDML